ncbi:divalent-cation tolerance protein CutA [Vibrio spartinae]|uniref:Divalent-cation tolerance protein CutA n=1 Tax=Vibrio spartinae TaxID=1918945 RepID=A0A1N6LZ78_9VIBR|nr:divalent-cation tolerance protein CutA [Vibrio spartinae]QMV16445.1 Divalent-cation tolerance protein CutA [Vibrio spartinae]SIO92483.1 Divalent-cation tolerance protein CutA [Vibrio spartinae]
MAETPFCMVLTTINSQEGCQTIISRLLSAQLVACIQTFPINSHYRWEGEICTDQEILLLMKTQSRHYQAVELAIREVHCYEVPQIIQIPVTDGFQAYLHWIETVTQHPEEQG